MIKVATFIILCYISTHSRKPLNTSYWAYKELTEDSYVELVSCDVPNVSYASVFEELNISTSAINYIKIQYLSPFPRLSAAHFTGLSINSLDISASQSGTTPEDNFLETLIPNLVMLTMAHVIMPPLPASNRITTLYLDGESFKGAFGECEEIKSITFREWNIYEDNFLSHCPKLRSIDVNRMSKTSLVHMMTGLRLLTYLKLTYSDLPSLPRDIFKDSVNLKSLVLTDCSVRVVESDAFEHLVNLEVLDLSYNELTHPTDLMDALTPLRSLRTLSVDVNRNFKICDRLDTPPPAPIEHLSLMWTSSNILCFKSWEKLRTLKLDTVDILEFSHLPRSKEHDVDVELRNPPAELPNNYESYKLMTTRLAAMRNLFVNASGAVSCDCQYGWLARALRELPNVHLRGVTCTDHPMHMPLQEAPIKYIECDKFLVDGCTCRRSWQDKSVKADCKNLQLQHIPEITNLQTLYATGNLIHTLDGASIPDTLLFADFRANRISSLSEKATNTLFSVPERHVQLSGNPIICDCNNKNFVKVLKSHNNQITDFDEITCVNDGRKLKDVIPDDLCFVSTVPFDYTILVVPAIVACVLISCFFLCYRFKLQIKVFLYSHGCCLSCLREEDLDDDRVFDAFISFCHWDDEFVNDNILLELSDYTLCIHYRDWVLGEWIPTQIALSVKHSRRTILILSKKFLASSWGMMEFRMAHAEALQEGRRRLIAILLDDVLDDQEMDAELRAYLSFNTYIKWGDPWFFQKLRYALPHKKGQVDNTTETGINCDDFRIAVENYRTGVYQIVPPETRTINNLTDNNESAI